MDIDPEQENLFDLEIKDFQNVDDEASVDNLDNFPFNITSYGADYTVDILVKRLKDEAFIIPDFQRLYVWTARQASRFIESLLLGLPVPGIFVFRQDNGQHLIVDGQQRLLSLMYFYLGWLPKGKDKKVFKLTEVRDPWNNKSYEELDREDRLRLDDSIIHTIIFRQDYPQDSKKSIYEVFERINTGGTKLSFQEIRVSVNSGAFAKLLRELNENKTWREIYGPKSVRLKDEELILRYLSLLYRRSSYARPMKGFLDEFMEVHTNLPNTTSSDFSNLFTTTIETIYSSIGKKSFRPQSSINTAVFDSVMIGISERLKKGPIKNIHNIADKYNVLLKDTDYIASYTRATADENNVSRRIDLACKAFEDVA